jgi:hypothetical protein
MRCMTELATHAPPRAAGEHEDFDEFFRSSSHRRSGNGKNASSDAPAERFRKGLPGPWRPYLLKKPIGGEKF